MPNGEFVRKDTKNGNLEVLGRKDSIIDNPEGVS